MDDNSHIFIDDAGITQAEQTRQLYDAFPQAVIGTIVNALLLTLVQWSVVDHNILVAWLMASLIITGGRYLLFLYYRSPTSRQSTPITLRFLTSDHLITQSLGAMGIMFFITLMLAAKRINQTNSNNITLRNQAIIRETLLKQAQQDQKRNEQRYHAITDNAADTIIIHTGNGKIIDANQQACISLNYSHNELLQLFISDIEVGIPNIQLNDIWENTSGIADTIISGTHQRKDGSQFPIEMRLSTITEGKQKLFIALIRDITERQKTDDLKNEFISTVSHELRTPLTSLSGALKILRHDSSESLPENAYSLIDLAGRNAERLGTLINDLLDIQKIEAGYTDFKAHPLELNHLIEKTIETNQPYAEQHNVHFLLIKETTPAWILGDTNRLTQIMTNLLSNAAKFSPDEDIIEIKIEKYGHNHRVSIADHGSGIPEEYQSRIFDKFTQSDATNTRSVGGTGLGLNIVKTLVEKHAGTIGFTSSNKGSCFYFDIPAIERPQQEPSFIPIVS